MKGRDLRGTYGVYGVSGRFSKIPPTGGGAVGACDEGGLDVQLEFTKLHRIDREARLWRALERLLAPGVTVALSRRATHAEALAYALEVRREDRRPETLEAEELEELLEVEWLSARSKKCRGPCGRELPLSEFGPHKEGQFGRYSRCRQCERNSRRWARPKKGGRAESRNLEAALLDKADAFAAAVRRRDRAERELAECRRRCEGLAERVASQSDQLSQNAERRKSANG